jgi:caa(3)-type oxidase subunit IV
MMIWAVLAVLMFGKVAVSLIGFAKPVAIAILVVISLLSALLVALYYMHLRFEPKVLWFLAATPLPLAAIFIIAVLTEF